MTTEKILIYDDLGAGDTKILVREMADYFTPRGVKIDMTNAHDITRRHALNRRILALVMPGGRAMGYQQRLNPRGNQIITDWVRGGGTYFGICAGAYYSARHVIFEPDIPELTVRQDGTLKLVSANAIGTLHRELDIAPYRADTQSMAAPQIEWTADARLHISYYHGGPYFEPTGHDKNLTTLAVYALDTGDKPPLSAKRSVTAALLHPGYMWKCPAPPWPGHLPNRPTLTQTRATWPTHCINMNHTANHCLTKSWRKSPQKNKIK